MPFSFLLVGPDAEQWADRADAEITAAPDLEAARGYLAGTVFDVVGVQEGMPIDGLRALCTALGVPTRVELVDSFDAAVRLASGAGGEETGPDDDDVQRALAELRDEMSRVAHSLNNPLSVIAGNAQLGLELSSALGVDADVVGAFEQIQSAAAELGGRFDEVATLRARIDRLLKGGVGR